MSIVGKVLSGLNREVVYIIMHFVMVHLHSQLQLFPLDRKSHGLH